MFKTTATARTLLITTIIVAAASADASVRMVRSGLRLGGDGLSWETAYTDLQDALAEAAAPGSDVDEIWVAQGTYLPSTTDATLSFVIPDGVGLYGGFAGNETSRDERDWTEHVSVLSGDIGQDDEVGSGQYWYTNWNIHTANAGHVVVTSDTGPDTVIDGFTIAAGHTGPPGTPAGSPLMFGSGIYNVNGSPTITNCIFTHNLAAFASGGGLYSINGAPTVTHCLFLENYVHLGNGGGLYSYQGAPVVEDCTFRFNQAVSATPDASGAGLGNFSAQALVVRRCTFDRNTARPFYAVGNDIAYGGGLSNFNGPLTVIDSVFTGNRATLGGGLQTWGPGSAVNCLFVDNVAVPHPNDPYPELGGTGAAISVNGVQGLPFTLTNCTIVSNDGKKYAVHGAGNATVVTTNCIFRDNTATSADVAGTFRVHIGGNFDASYSNIRNIFDPPEPGEDPIDPENIPGCIDANPQFVDGFHLAPGSPCIDAGDATALPPDVTTDLDGLARQYDDPATPDSGIGDPAVDMGAYEFQPPPPACPADLDDDGIVGAPDLAVMLAAWGPAPGHPADLDDDGAVGPADLAGLLAAWGPCA